MIKNKNNKMKKLKVKKVMIMGIKRKTNFRKTIKKIMGNLTKNNKKDKWQSKRKRMKLKINKNRKALLNKKKKSNNKKQW